MNKQSKLSGAILYGSLVAFIGFVVYILFINQEVFYTAHDRSEFIFGAPFYHTLLSKPFGLMQYVGAWLTQLFYHPVFGAGVLLAIWVCIFFVGVKSFRLRGSASALMLLPVACLLVSVVDLGYWIYISTIRGYWFSQSVGYLLMLLLLWAARCTPRKWHLAWYLLGFCIYPVLGWFAMLFVLCLALSGKPSWRELIAIFLLIFAAGIWHTLLYSNIKFDDVMMAGFPRIENPLDRSEYLSIPFWVLGAVSVLIPFGRLVYLSFSRLGKSSTKDSSPNDQTTKRPNSLTTIFVPVLCAVAGIVFTCSLMFRDQNYVDEMRMVRYASNDNWQEVLRMAEGNKKPTVTMVFLKNIALMNEGGLLNHSFKRGNISFPTFNPDSLHVSLLEIASPLVYYNYGMMNEAIRLSFENTIQRGFSPFYLKMLARCALAVGDNKLVERYTTILHHHPFYDNWQPAPVTEKIKELQTCYPDEVSGVENTDSYIVNSISFWYESDSKVASEQALFYAMISCDSRRFWASLRNYVELHMDEEFPVHAQEAYILFMDKAPEEKRMMLPVEEDIYNRYKQFCETLARLVKPGKTIGKVAEEMSKEWGDTYWYYNYFGRQYTNIVDRKENEVAS
ncbi:MAG: hypothetical protein J5552_10605 [Prevotella sp.]|nr:hypothetical protein [Prevotella sp.]